MYSKKSFNFILTLIVAISFNSCSSKLKKTENKIKKPKIESLDKRLQTIKNSIDKENFILIKENKNYLEIDLNNEYDFRRGSYILTKDAKDRLKYIANIIKDRKDIYIVVAGHANEASNKEQNQHLSDNRAISVAELLFNSGIRDEIFAKGCSNSKIDINDKLKGRKIKLYIYIDKANIKNHCK